MKLIELIHKHPFLTFFIVDEVLVTVQNCVSMITNAQWENKEPESVKILNEAAGVVMKFKSDSSEETEDEDE